MRGLVAGALLLALAAAPGSALGNQESPVHNWKGKVSVVGNEPFTRVILSDLDGQHWRIEADDPTILADLRARAQGSQVVVEGRRKGKETLVVASWVFLED